MKPRAFLLAGAALVATASSARASEAPLFPAGTRILFQGDSITDMNRGRTADPNHILGHSYVFVIASRQGAAFPELHLTFINRGVSGNRVADLAKRWQADTLDLKPDVLSILIGINDVDAAFRRNQPLDVAEFEKGYDQLLADTVAALPKIKFVLLEPFILPGKHNADRPDEWRAKMIEVRAAVARLAAKYHAPVVPLQKVFDDACQRAPADYWIWDGIHPTYSGHQLIADEWERVYRAFYGAPSAPR
ncbi:MAG TPA: SGNH/GDSL hydrolase family protein [Opitutaceae bacterium]|nr:SGNH/GDSL hydrolase family protein [Opitutaceae bacterium]